MKVIAGYDATVTGSTKRGSIIRVICTRPGPVAIDITSAVQVVSVTDTLEPAPSRASVQISRGMADGWLDPTAALSPWEPGNRISIEMGEVGGVLTCIFEGTIMSGGDNSGVPEARNTIQAIGGNAQWWQRRVTTENYLATDTDDIVEDVFETWGGLTAPGDFNLPGVARILSAMQSLEQAIMPLAFDLYAAQSVIPWWDPVALQLTTLDAAIPGGPDIILPDVQRSQLNLSWATPDSTRVRLEGGVQQPVVRVEIGQWTTPYNKFVVGPDNRHVGLRWASGGINDAHEPPFWAQSDGTFPHGGLWAAGDYLWVEFYGQQDVGGDGYRGPEGVEWIMNDPLVSVDPVNFVVVKAIGIALLFPPTLGYIEHDRFNTTEDRQIASVLLSLNAPAPGFTDAEKWAAIISTGSPLDFELWGRQKEPNSAQQISAQDWDDTGITAHGDQAEQIRNATLLTATAPYSDVEAESVRLMAVEEALRLPATVELAGQDLRLQPGDCISTPHPRDAYNVYIWIRTVTQKWTSSKATTSLVGSVIGTNP